MEETHIAENGIDQTTNTTANPKYDKQINRRLLYYAHHPRFIDHRLRQLDRETSIEFLIETSSATLSLSGILLGATTDKRWLLLSVLAAGLLILKGVSRNDALKTWLRQQGYRTQDEITHERYVLRALRGDFDAIGSAEQDLPEERVRQIMHSMKVD